MYHGTHSVTRSKKPSPLPHNDDEQHCSKDKPEKGENRTGECREWVGIGCDLE